MLFPLTARALARKLRAWQRLPGFVRAWLVPVWLLLGMAKLLIFSVTFRRLAPHLGHAAGASAFLPLLTPTHQDRARLISRAVQTAARYTPWNSNCFPQAVVARVLLGIYGIPYTLCFGLMRDAASGEIQAHAWVIAGPVAVTGGHSFERFTVVGVFTSLPATQP